MTMYSQFETDPKLESEGVWVDYGDFRILLAHAGGANKRFQSYADQKLKPMRRAISAGTVDPERGDAVMRDIYAESIVLSWEVLQRDPETNEEHWRVGIHDRDGSVMPFTKENVMRTFKNLPKLFLDIQETSQSIALYRAQQQEEEAKN